MRRLSAPIGAIPRAFKDHRRPDAKRYKEACIAVQEQYGPVPRFLLPMLREYGRAVVELERLGFDLELARARKQRREAARIRKQQFMLREQGARLLNRFEQLAPPRSSSPMDALANRPEVRS